jgi:hypothetical protein
MARVISLLTAYYNGEVQVILVSDWPIFKNLLL